LNISKEIDDLNETGKPGKKHLALLGVWKEILSILIIVNNLRHLNRKSEIS
jgi:hypothetical protein